MTVGFERHGLSSMSRRTQRKPRRGGRCSAARRGMRGLSRWPNPPGSAKVTEIPNRWHPLSKIPTGLPTHLGRGLPALPPVSMLVSAPRIEAVDLARHCRGSVRRCVARGTVPLATTPAGVLHPSGGGLTGLLTMNERREIIKYYHRAAEGAAGRTRRDFCGLGNGSAEHRGTPVGA